PCVYQLQPGWRHLSEIPKLRQGLGQENMPGQLWRVMCVFARALRFLGVNGFGYRRQLLEEFKVLKKHVGRCVPSQLISELLGSGGSEPIGRVRRAVAKFSDGARPRGESKQIVLDCLALSCNCIKQRREAKVILLVQ